MAANQTAPLMETRHLTKSFRGRKIVDDLNIRVMKGDVYGFLGRNGQGKTTTIRMMTGLVFPDSGDVLIKGVSLRREFKRAISHIGAIVETPAFHDYLTGGENLALMARLAPGVTKSRIREVLDIVGLSGWARDKVRTYSLGMKQRLGIANALLHEPELIILDEPTNGLDPQGMKEIKELILQLAAEKNITFFISSHLLHEMQQLCNRFGIIQNGRLLIEGDMRELAALAGDFSLEQLYFEATRS
jgi:ABC-type multidrug transport system, ATPase component